MNEIDLVFPTKAHEVAAKAFYQEHLDAGEDTLHGSSGLDRLESYDEWLDKINDALYREIHSVVFFGVRRADRKIVGIINIRYPYKGYVQVHGHIGYGVCPSERQKGYATEMLKIALARCRELGLTEVLLTCNKGNTASEKTIRKCGGVFESEVLHEDGCLVQRYWIRL